MLRKELAAKAGRLSRSADPHDRRPQESRAGRRAGRSRLSIVYSRRSLREAADGGDLADRRTHGVERVSSTTTACGRNMQRRKSFRPQHLGAHISTLHNIRYNCLKTNDLFNRCSPYIPPSDCGAVAACRVTTWQPRTNCPGTRGAEKPQLAPRSWSPLFKTPRRTLQGHMTERATCHRSRPATYPGIWSALPAVVNVDPRASRCRPLCPPMPGKEQNRAPVQCQADATGSNGCFAISSPFGGKEVAKTHQSPRTLRHD
jgi:hypothetical protein